MKTTKQISYSEYFNHNPIIFAEMKRIDKNNYKVSLMDYMKFMTKKMEEILDDEELCKVIENYTFERQFGKPSDGVNMPNQSPTA